MGEEEAERIWAASGCAASDVAIGKVRNKKTSSRSTLAAVSLGPSAGPVSSASVAAFQAGPAPAQYPRAALSQGPQGESRCHG